MTNKPYKLTPQSAAYAKRLSQVMNCSNETARRRISNVKLKLGYEIISVGDFLRHTDSIIPDKETWFD